MAEKLPDWTIGMLTFPLNNIKEIEGLFTILEWHNKHGGWPPLPVEEVPEPKPLYTATVTQPLSVRDETGKALGVALPTGALVSVWELLASIPGGFTNRAVIDPAGTVPRRNVWNVGLKRI